MRIALGLENGTVHDSWYHYSTLDVQTDRDLLSLQTALFCLSKHYARPRFLDESGDTPVPLISPSDCIKSVM